MEVIPIVDALAVLIRCCVWGIQSLSWGLDASGVPISPVGVCAWEFLELWPSQKWLPSEMAPSVKQRSVLFRAGHQGMLGPWPFAKGFLQSLLVPAVAVVSCHFWGSLLSHPHLALGPQEQNEIRI